MPIYRQRYFPYLVLLLLCIPLFFFNIQDVHPWGDDFSLYIKEAVNIANGRPFNEHTWVFSHHNIDYSPPQYPAGYPLLLAPVVKAYGLNITALNYFNSFIAACLLLALYAFFRNYAGKVASVCLAVIISYGQYMLSLKSNVVADVPCMLSIVLYLWLRDTGKRDAVSIALLIFFAVFAIQCRSQAICIVIGECILWVIEATKETVRRREGWGRRIFTLPQVYVVPGVLLLHFMIGRFVFPVTVSTMPFYYDIFHRAYEQSSFRNLHRDVYDTLGYVAALLYPDGSVPQEAKMATIAMRVGIWLAIMGFIIKVVRKITTGDLFFLAMLALLMYYPFKDLRYFIPLLPLLVLYIYLVVRKVFLLAPRVRPAYIAVAFTIVYFIYGFEPIKKVATERPGGCIPEQREKDAFGYITTHVNDSDVILFTKPRALALFTGKRTANMSWHLSHTDCKKVFDSIGVRYVLTLNGFDDRFFKDYMYDVSPPVDSQGIGAGYTLYRLP